ASCDLSVTLSDGLGWAAFFLTSLTLRSGWRFDLAIASAWFPRCFDTFPPKPRLERGFALLWPVTDFRKGLHLLAIRPHDRTRRWCPEPGADLVLLAVGPRSCCCFRGARAARRAAPPPRRPQRRCQARRRSPPHRRRALKRGRQPPRSPRRPTMRAPRQRGAAAGSGWSSARRTQRARGWSCAA